MVIHDGIIYEPTYMNKLKAVGFVTGYKTNNVIIPELINSKKVIEIAPSAFIGQSCIEQVLLPETLEIIGADAFANCSNLKTVELTPVIDFEEKLTLVISNNAFCNCWKFTQFLGYGRIVTLKTKCFAYCYELNDLDIKVQQVDDLAFFNCNSLRQITFSPSARLSKRCLIGSDMKELQFRGDGIIPQDVLVMLKQNNTKIRCAETSNLAMLAYLGYYTEII